MENSFLLVFWRLWKWLVRLVTGKCEIVRLCEKNVSLEEKAWMIEQSLRNSRSTDLQGVVKAGGVSVDEAERAIVREKGLVLHQDQLRPLLERICGVCALRADVESVRAESYSQDTEEHERALNELWNQLMPNTTLEARISKQWQDIGFQGNNPATDFRGMGVLSLYCMLHLATVHRDKARSLLSHSHHPQHPYPWAVVGINLTSTLYCWLNEGTLSRYLYTSVSHWPIPRDEFMEIFCYLFDEFDKFWTESRPENVMAFSTVKANFKKRIEERELGGRRGKITHTMRLH